MDPGAGRPGSPSASGAAPAAAPGVVGTWALDYVAKPTTMSTSSCSTSTRRAGGRRRHGGGGGEDDVGVRARARALDVLRRRGRGGGGARELRDPRGAGAARDASGARDGRVVGVAVRVVGVGGVVAGGLRLRGGGGAAPAHRVSAAAAAAAEGLAGAGGTIMCHLDVVGASRRSGGRWRGRRRWRGRPLVVAAVLIASHGLAC